MSKKTFATIGTIVSILLVIVGLLVLFGVFGGAARYPNSAPYSYDSGYATFGGDFYTYVVNNAGEAASASRTAAINTMELCNLMRNVGGILLISFGLFGFCGFGILRRVFTLPAEQPEPTTEEPSAICSTEEEQ